MKQQKTLNSNKGITLIALVITIIVMLILVAVTITMAVNGGLFEKAGQAVADTQNAIDKEQTLADGKIQIDNVWYNSVDEYLIASGIKEEPIETIPTTVSYVGCYADVNGDGTPDGIIYADLAVGITCDEDVYADYYKDFYTIPKETGLKDYYISKTDYIGTFGTKPRNVIKSLSGEGKDRFYVMALSDLDTQKYTWYESKDAEKIEEGAGDYFEIGTGKTNTEAMIKVWNNDKDEAKSSKDVWGNIQTQVNNGWFLPSLPEWYAFIGELEISEGNYHNFGLSSNYWSTYYYWDVDLSEALVMMFCLNAPLQVFEWEYSVGNDASVRLSTTF